MRRALSAICNCLLLTDYSPTTINDYDWCITTGKPFAYRLLFGIFNPKRKLRIPGMEVAGIVEQLGNKATKFKVGDAVYGDISNFGFGSFAEFLCIDEKALALKPDSMGFEDLKEGTTAFLDKRKADFPRKKKI